MVARPVGPVQLVIDFARLVLSSGAYEGEIQDLLVEALKLSPKGSGGSQGRVSQEAPPSNPNKLNRSEARLMMIERVKKEVGPDWISIGEVAEMLGYHPSTISALAREIKLQFKETSVLNFLSVKEVELLRSAFERIRRSFPEVGEKRLLKYVKNSFLSSQETRHSANL